MGTGPRLRENRITPASPHQGPQAALSAQQSLVSCQLGSELSSTPELPTPSREGPEGQSRGDKDGTNVCSRPGRTRTTRTASPSHQPGLRALQPQGPAPGATPGRAADAHLLHRGGEGVPQFRQGNGQGELGEDRRQVVRWELAGEVLGQRGEPGDRGEASGSSADLRSVQAPAPSPGARGGRQGVQHGGWTGMGAMRTEASCFPCTTAPPSPQVKAKAPDPPPGARGSRPGAGAGRAGLGAGGRRDSQTHAGVGRQHVDVVLAQRVDDDGLAPVNQVRCQLENLRAEVAGKTVPTGRPTRSPRRTATRLPLTGPRAVLAGRSTGMPGVPQVSSAKPRAWLHSLAEAGPSAHQVPSTGKGSLVTMDVDVTAPAPTPHVIPEECSPVLLSWTLRLRMAQTGRCAGGEARVRTWHLVLPVQHHCSHRPPKGSSPVQALGTPSPGPQAGLPVALPTRDTKETSVPPLTLSPLTQVPATMAQRTQAYLPPSLPPASSPCRQSAPWRPEN